MSNYNDGKYIERAVHGVLAQEYQPREIIIIDDGSSDNSVEIVRGLMSRYPQIRLIVNEHNQGVCFSFNRALAQTTTEFVSFVSMDDWNHPTWLAKSMKMFELHPHAVICASDLYQTHKDTPGGEHYTRTLPFSFTEPVFISGRDYAHIVKTGYIAATSVVVKTEKMLEVGAYRENLKWHSDWFAWHVIAMRYGLCFIPQPLVTLQVRATSHSSIGIGKWEEQSKVLFNIIKTINSPEFVDILPHFLWSGVMGHFGPNIARVIVEDPSLWNMHNFQMIRAFFSPEEFARLPLAQVAA